MDFGQYLRKCRKASGVSLRHVSQCLDVRHSYLSEVERGLRWPLRPCYFDELQQLIPSIDRIELETLYLLAVIGCLDRSKRLDGLDHAMLQVCK